MAQERVGQVDCTGLPEFCSEAFASLGRADQRNAAETYVRGLLNCDGRKTIPRLAVASPGRSEQSLQQFINQSPWEHGPVRKWLAERMVRDFRPEAWVVGELAFPKHGRYSAAVERQYVHSHGRVRNCQLAIMVGMQVGGVTVPVNWSLTIPEQWGQDDERRSRAKVPESELPRPYWQYHVELLDDMALDWGVPEAPILLDARHRPLEWYLAALEMRAQTYLAQVSPNELVQPADASWARGSGRIVNSQGARARARTVADIAASVGNVTPETLYWRDAGGHTLRSQFLVIPVQVLVGSGRPAGSKALLANRLLIVEWPLGKPSPRGYWLTNIRGASLRELVRLAKKVSTATPQAAELASGYGLFDYEGRTFNGWHHHATMVSAALDYDILNGAHLGRDEFEESPGPELTELVR
ncbi:IS701 family transposase [Kitasatospora sp. NPDC004289]